jgi:ParB family chromosome partitioning protein
LVFGNARRVRGQNFVASERQAAREIISRSLSVRDTEALVRKLAAPPAEPREKKAPAQTDVHTRAAEDRMRFSLGTKVRIVRRGQAGTIEIDFGSESELNRLYELLTEKGPKP